MKSTAKFFQIYLVPLAILAALFFALRWVPVQMTLAWLVPLAAEIVPATVPPLQIILFIGLTVGGPFAVAILTITRYLHRRVAHRQRLKTLQDKRKRGHDDIAASVFDSSRTGIEADDQQSTTTRAFCALEQDPRLALLIGTLWAKPEFYNFLQRLLKADTGACKMLTGEVRRELTFLCNLYLDQNHIFTQPALAAGHHTRSANDRWRGVA